MAEPPVEERQKLRFAVEKPMLRAVGGAGTGGRWDGCQARNFAGPLLRGHLPTKSGRPVRLPAFGSCLIDSLFLSGINGARCN